MLNCTPQGELVVAIKKLWLLGSTNKREFSGCVVFPAELVQEFDPIHNLPEEPPRLKKADERWRSSSTDLVGWILKALSLTRSTVALRRGFDHGSSWRSPRGFSFKTLKTEARWTGTTLTLGSRLGLRRLWRRGNGVGRQEEARLSNLNRPNTKWSYDFTKAVYVKVILDRHPLFLGLGRLPDWLRNKHGVLSLDTYDDNRCLFRCIAVHWGATPKRNMRKTRGFFHPTSRSAKPAYRQAPIPSWNDFQARYCCLHGAA